MKELKPLEKDTIEITKQVQKKIELVLIDLIEPYNNHIVYEVNLCKETIKVADYEEQSKTINWFDAVNKNYSHKGGKILIRKKDCIYVSSLNVKNLRSKLRKIGVNNVHSYLYTPNQHDSGSYLKVEIKEVKSI